MSCSFPHPPSNAPKRGLPLWRPRALASVCARLAPMARPQLPMAISFMALGPILGLAISAPAFSLAQDTSSAQVEADLAFAEGLASKWGFVDLAEGVLANVNAGDLSDRQQDQLALVGCSLYSQGARLEKDAAKRRELFDRALGEYQGFMDSNSNSPLIDQASAEYVATAFTYSQYLGQDLEDAVGDEAATLKERQSEILMGSVQLTGETISSLQSIPEEERTQRQTRQMYQLMLQRGQMLAAIGANSTDGEFYFSQAMDSLRELASDAGDGTAGAFLAFDAMGAVFAVQSKWMESALFYDAVLESTIPFEIAAWQAAKEDEELGVPAIEMRFSFVQLSVDGSIEAYLAQGDNETALARAMYFINTWKLEGVGLNRNGQEALLVVAAALLESHGFVGGDLSSGKGKWYATEEAMRNEVRSRRDRTDTTTLATELASEISETASFGYLRTRAQKLLADISDTPGVEVSPALQMEGIMGEYRSGNLDVAVDKALNLSRALAAGESSERLELMPTLCNVLGNIYRKQERPLEAAMAFREGVDKYAGGDLDMDGANARAFNALMALLVDPTQTSGPLAKLLKDSEALVLKHSIGDADGILFKAANKLERREDYQGAITKYKQVPLSGNWGERALVQRGLCQLRLKKMDAALALFDQFLNEVVPDPQYNTESPRRKGNRKQALATAEFYRSVVLYTKKQYQNVITQLADFSGRHRDQESLCRSAYSLTMRAHLGLSQIKQARAALDALKDFAPDSPVTAKASTTMYLTVSKQRTGQEETDKGRELLQAMAELLEVSNSVGSPTYGSLWNEAKHWIDLGTDDKALVTLRRVHARFGAAEDAEIRKKINSFVTPELARLLLVNHEINEASALLTPLALQMIEAEKDGGKSRLLGRNATIYFARSIAGWLEGGQDGKPIVEVPGTGGNPELFRFITKKLGTFASQRDTFSCEWFELKFMLIYATYQWGKVDSSLAGSVDTQLKAIAGQMSNTSWDDVDQICEDEENEAIKARTTGHALRNYFRWLAAKAK